MREPRLRSLLVVVALIGAPAVVLRVACVGNGCPDTSADAPGRVPFCSLPADTRAAIVSGYREGRSPDVMATTAAAGVGARVGESRLAWPSVASDLRVPIAFIGTNVRAGPLPDGTGLDQIAPTLEGLLGIHRPFPGVRAGTAVEGVADGPAAPLVLELVWKGIGSADLTAEPTAWPWLRRTIGEGAGTLRGTTGSLPLDPAATITTIGTGGLPSQHGITGTLLRNNSGALVGAFGAGGPIPVLATLPDDLDHAAHERAFVGLIASAAADRGLIGGDWYVGSDHDDLVVAPPDPVAAARAMLDHGYGRDATPDVLGVVMDGPLRSIDRRSAAIAAMVLSRVPNAIVVIAGSGAATPPAGATDARALTSALDAVMPGADRAVAAIGADGLFLDPGAAAAAGIGADPLAAALAEARVAGIGLADAYPGFSVSLARYC